MLEGIADGSVDVIATDHAPHHADEKMVEFDRAPFGIVGLETAVPIVFDRLVHAGRDLADAAWSSCCRSIRRALMNLPGGSLAEGAPADITILGAGSAVDDRRRQAACRNRRTRRSIAGSSPAASSQPSLEEGSCIAMPLLSEKRPYHVTRQDDLRRQALKTLQELEVPDARRALRLRQRISRPALPQSPPAVPAPVDDLAARAGSARCVPAEILRKRTSWPGPATGGALLAHTLAGLLDGRRALTHPPCSFAPFTNAGRRLRAAKLLRATRWRPARAARGRRAEHRQDACSAARSSSRTPADGDRHGRNLRSHGSDRRSRRAELRARGVSRAARITRVADCPMCKAGDTDHDVLEQPMPHFVAATVLSAIRRNCQAPVVGPVPPVAWPRKPNTCRVAAVAATSVATARANPTV